MLWFLCCHELIFWRVINLKYSTKSLQISSKPLKRSLHCRSSLFVVQALVGSPISRACLKRLSTAGSWPWLSYATHLSSSTAAKAAISRHLLWFSEASTLTFRCRTLRLTQMDSKYWLTFFGTFEFDGFFKKLIYQVLESNIYIKSKQFTLG